MRALYRAIWLWLLLFNPSWVIGEEFTKLLHFAEEPAALSKRDEDLDAHGAFLVKAVVLFRHGARTPLSDRYATAALSFGGKPHSARRRALRQATAAGGEQEQPRQLQAEFDLVSSSGGKGGVHWGRPGACEYTVQGPPLELRSQPGAPQLRPDDVAEMEAALLCEGPVSPAAVSPLPAGLLPGGGRGAAARDTTPVARGCGRGQLTRLGYMQAVALGRWLRGRYGVTTAGLAHHFGNGSSSGSSSSSSGGDDHQGPAPARRRFLHPLPPAPIGARSTHVSRALLTLQGVLEGLLPLQPAEVNGSAAGAASPHHHLIHHHSQHPQQQAHPAHEYPFGRHPVPVAVAPAGHQLLYANTDQCPRLAQLARLADRAAQVLGDADSTGDEGRVRSALGLPPQRHDAPSTWLSWKRLLDAAMCEEAARGEAGVAEDVERLAEQLQQAQGGPAAAATAAAGRGGDSRRRQRALLRHKEAAAAAAGDRHPAAQTPAAAGYDDFLSRVVGGSRTAEVAGLINCDGSGAGGGGAGSHEGDGQGRLLLSASARRPWLPQQQQQQQLGLGLGEAAARAQQLEQGQEQEPRKVKGLGLAAPGKDGEDGEDEEWEQAAEAAAVARVGGRARRALAGTLEGRDGEEEDEEGGGGEGGEGGDGGADSGLTPDLYSVVDWQATRRVAAVLGPPCNGTGLCQQLLQLGIGLLLRELVDGLRLAAAAAEARLAAAAAGQPLPAQGLPGAAPGAVAAVGVPPVALLDLYSGHDSTLMPLLAALGNAVDRWPPFVGNLLIELYRVPRAGGGGKAPGGGGGGSDDAGAWMRSPEVGEDEKQEQQEEQGNEGDGEQEGASEQGERRRSAAEQRSADAADASGALAAAVEGQARAAVRRQRRRKLVRGGDADGSSASSGSSSSSSSSDLWTAFWQGSGFGRLATSQGGSDGRGSSTSSSTSGNARRRLAAAVQRPKRRWRAAADDAEAAGDSLLGMEGGGLEASHVRALLQAGGKQGTRQQQQEQQQEETEEKRGQQQSGQQQQEGGSGSGSSGDAEYRVRMLYNLEQLWVDTPGEGRTWLPRLSDLEALLAPYAVGRPAYVSACRHVEDLAGLLEAQIGKSGAAASHGHFFDGDQEAAQAEHKRLQRERVEQLRQQRSQVAKAAAAAKADKARQQQQQ
ncbi:hypothetical protein HXX76_003155 [Chlamydomonas incerta]|uniref:Acid phosphatase n=1 Tax=Chlamydomonas incerta TaxID=51695 RepID=A0A835T9Y0_CHLIN|nr:hypothetical protein HXX76_003155 [Chlamydomonas incerta]|eukprot:KAG2441534.1 hypothetical protein HXX76_003155 [Chlamydomonas incerta]